MGKPSLFLLQTLVLLSLAIPLWGQSEPDRLVRVSGDSPFTSCVADFPQFQPGTNFPASEVEPWIAVNPLDPDHLIATWQQDRWSNGSARGAGVSVSFDGGESWDSRPMPRLTLCTGGPFLRASDPWVTFGADGSAYHMSLATDGRTGRNAMVVQKSGDGGLTWSDPLSLIDEFPPVFNDKNTMTADPNDARFVYATWDRLDFVNGGGPAVFTRTTDGGESWETVQRVHDPGVTGQTIGNQIVVQPDGTVIDFFNDVGFVPFFQQFVALKRSEDRGESWEPGGPDGPSIRVAQMLPTFAIRDPDRQIPIRASSILFDVAVDPNDGTLYAVWTDARFNGFQWDMIALSISRDDGDTWTTPVPVNRTPINIPILNRQAFVPSVHVNDEGRVAITYYDFRHNGDEPESLTDHWAITCMPAADGGEPLQLAPVAGQIPPRARGNCADPRNWSGEVRLTSESFDILRAPLVTTPGLFLGDYVGLTSAGDTFFALYSATEGSDPSDAFAATFTEGPPWTGGAFLLNPPEGAAATREALDSRSPAWPLER